jgi:hypothetical protein
MPTTNDINIGDDALLTTELADNDRITITRAATGQRIATMTVANFMAKCAAMMPPQKKAPNGRGCKTILTNNGSWLEYSHATRILTIPTNARILDSRGVVVAIPPGEVSIRGSNVGFFNIFINLTSGEVVSVFYADITEPYWDETLFCWVGWVHTEMNKIELKAWQYKVDGVIYGPGK